MLPPPPRAAALRPAPLRLDEQGREIDEFGNPVVRSEVKPTSSLKVGTNSLLTHHAVTIVFLTDGVMHTQGLRVLSTAKRLNCVLHCR